MDDKKAKLKIKLPPGAEFEAEGSEDFILKEKEAFLKIVNGETWQNGAQQPLKTKEEDHSQIWQLIVAIDKDIPYIIKKNAALKPYEAALILMAGQRALKAVEEISAINLSKGLKLSGLKTDRIDRELASLIKENKISAFGYKRSRSYKINAKGIQDAYLKALEIMRS